MATYNVSTASQLQNALKSAKGGDAIKLSAGNYGKLELYNKNYGGDVTITSAGSVKAKFTGIVGSNVHSVTIDKVSFADGNDWGIRLTKSSHIKITNSTFNNLYSGLKLQGTSDIVVQNNAFSKMTIDAMNFVGISNAVIQNNKYTESGSKSGYTHKDFIQFYTKNITGSGPSKNVKIIGNEFYSKDGLTHGIFMHNEAHNGMHQNIVIQGNYLKSSHTLGIAVVEANGLLVQNNTLIKDGKLFPLINVSPNSMNVKILGNTAPSVPDLGNKSWVVSGNNETTSSKVVHWTGGITSGIKVANSGSTAGAASLAKSAETGDSTGGSEIDAIAGRGDNIHFYKSSLGKGTKVSTVKGFDFDDRDALIFHGYERGTFKDAAGGNLAHMSVEGSWARFDSVADLKEIDKVSAAVSISADKSADVLTLSINQDALVHKIVLDGLAHDYLV